MAYGEKYRLFFDDVDGRQYKLDILQKDYTGAVSNLIGGADPVQIEWVADEDIYNPIIGSRCKLDLYVTDNNVYDEFFKGDERTYKVVIAGYKPTGIEYEEGDILWNNVDFKWNSNLGGLSYGLKIWEGFLVLDSYQEFVTTAPFPLRLEAIDGLGTLEGFNAPFNTTTTEKSAFYYLQQILKLTGLDLPIKIANDIRKVGETDAEETVFHDIMLNDYAMFDEKLNHLTAKKALDNILRITNSRVFQEAGFWYVISNSGLIDKDVDQLALAPSGADIINQPDVTDFFNLVKTPAGTIVGNTTQEVGGDFVFSLRNDAGLFGNWSTITWTLPDSSNVSGVDEVRFTATSAMNGNDISVSFSNSAGSNSASRTVTVTTSATPPTQTNLEINIYVDASELVNCEASPLHQRIVYNSNQVGNAVDVEDIKITANNLYKLANNQAITATGNLTIASFTGVDAFSTGGFKTLNAAFSSFNYPSTSTVYNVKLTGEAIKEIVRRTINITDSVNNATVKKNGNIITSIDIDGEPDSEARVTFDIIPDANFQFDSSYNITGKFTSNIQGLRFIPDLKSASKIEGLIIADIGFAAETSTLTLTGTAVTDGNATTLDLDPPATDNGTIVIAGNGGFLDGTLTTDGDFTVTQSASWVEFAPKSGTSNNDRFSLTFQPNKTGSNRSTTITFNAGGSQIQSVTITQGTFDFDGLFASNEIFIGG